MNLHPELAVLSARYDELVEAVERGQLAADVAMQTLSTMVAVDATGAEWRLDPSGTWLRAMPGSSPVAADPSSFVTTAGYADNGWGGSLNYPSGSGATDPYAMPPVMQGGNRGFEGYGDPYRSADSFQQAQRADEYTQHAVDDPAYSNGTDRRPAGGLRAFTSLLPRIPKLPHVSLPTGRSRTILIVVLCLIIIGGVFSRNQKPVTITPGQQTTSETAPQTDQAAETVAETPSEVTVSEPVIDPAAATTDTTIDRPVVAVAANGKITMKQAQAVVTALTGPAANRATVTGAVGRDLVDVAGELAGAKALGFKVRVTKIVVSGDTSSEITISATSPTNKSVVNWSLRLVVAHGNWVVGGYPKKL